MCHVINIAYLQYKQQEFCRVLHEEMNLTAVYVEGGSPGGKYILMNQPTEVYGWTNNTNLTPAKAFQSNVVQAVKSKQNQTSNNVHGTYSGVSIYAVHSFCSLRLICSYLVSFRQSTCIVHFKLSWSHFVCCFNISIH